MNQRTSSEVQLLPLADIQVDPELQSRAQISQEVVAEYAELYRAGKPLPPVDVCFDGDVYWLWDGFHREVATRRAELVEIECRIRPGTRRDALLRSLGANAAHGLRRSNADKRRAVLVLLKDSEWGQWSDREIARRAGVSHTFVSTVRGGLSGNGCQMPDERKVTRGGTQYTITVPARPAPPKQPAAPAPPSQPEAFRITKPAMLRAVKLIIDEEFAIWPDRIDEEMVLELFRHGIVEWMQRPDCYPEIRLTRHGLDLAQEAGLQPYDIESAEEWIESYQEMMDLYDRNITPWYMDPAHPSYRSDAAKAMRLIDGAPEPAEDAEAEADDGQQEEQVEAPPAPPHLARSTGNEERYTPPEILQAVRLVAGDIELDVASCELAQRHVKAERYLTIEDDALAPMCEWRAGVLWMNPPYTRGKIDKFVDKLMSCMGVGDVTHAFTLTNNATSEQWGQKLLRRSDAACFVDGRIKFYEPDGEGGMVQLKSGGLQGQMLCYFGRFAEPFCRVFADFGPCFVNQRRALDVATERSRRVREDLLLEDS